jgi:hypothetical protein
MPITTSNSKYGVGEVHEDSDPMAERSATVTRRVQPARGKGFCEVETSMPITAPNLKIGCLVGEDLKAIVQTSVGHKSGALFTHFALVAHKEGGRRERRYWTGTRSPNGVRPWKTIVEAYAGHNQGRCSLLCIAVCPRTHVLLCPCIHVSLCRCLVSEEQRRDIVEAMEGNSADVCWSQIMGAVHSSCLGHKVRRRRDPQGLKSDGRGVC